MAATYIFGYRLALLVAGAGALYLAEYFSWTVSYQVMAALVGVGMRSHAGIASKMFRVLAEENINIRMVSTSEIKISVVIDEKAMELAVRALHTAFGLDKDSIQSE